MSQFCDTRDQFWGQEVPKCLFQSQRRENWKILLMVRSSQDIELPKYQLIFNYGIHFQLQNLLQVKKLKNQWFNYAALRFLFCNTNNDCFTVTKYQRRLKVSFYNCWQRDKTSHHNIWLRKSFKIFDIDLNGFSEKTGWIFFERIETCCITGNKHLSKDFK